VGSDAPGKWTVSRRGLLRALVVPAAAVAVAGCRRPAPAPAQGPGPATESGAHEDVDPGVRAVRQFVLPLAAEPPCLFRPAFPEER
jgi:hypothetical protein